MNHLPKGDLKKIDELAETLMWIQGLPKEKKLIIDNKLKLIGTDIKRSLTELLERPENFIRTDIPLPDKEDPESIKSFLYKMQGQGRQGRDTLNIAPGKISSLFNQHHVAGLMEVFPNYAGKTAAEAWDISKNIYEDTGVRPGSHGGNLVEISGHKLVHLDKGHGGSYSAPKITGTPKEMLLKTKGAITLNLQRAGLAQEATLPLSNYINKNMSDGGIILADDPFFDTAITPAKAKDYRAAVTKGLKLNNNGKIPSNTDILEMSGMNAQLARLSGKNFRAAGMGALAGFALDPEAIKQAAKGDYTGAAQSALIGEGASQFTQRVGIPAVKAVANPIIKKIAPVITNGAAHLAPMIAPLAPVVAPLSIGATIGDLMNTFLPKTSHTSGRGAGRAAFNN